MNKTNDNIYIVSGTLLMKFSLYSERSVYILLLVLFIDFIIYGVKLNIFKKLNMILKCMNDFLSINSPKILKFLIFNIISTVTKILMTHVLWLYVRRYLSTISKLYFLKPQKTL